MAEVRCPLKEAAHISQNETAMVWDDHELTFFELDQVVTGVAQRLGDIGVKVGDRLAIQSDTSWQMVAFFLGVLRVGAVACPLSPRLPSTAAGNAIVSIQARGFFSDNIASPAESIPGNKLANFVKPPEARRPVVDATNPTLERDATIVFTSGSTSDGKAVVLSYGNHYYSALGSNLNLRVRTRDRWLLSIPLYHVGGIGIVFRCLLAGATMVIPAPNGDIVETAEGTKATHCSMVATQLYRTMQHADANGVQNLRAILLGGGPVPTSLLQKAAQRGLPVYLTYGTTETASQVCTESDADRVAEPRTVGHVLRYREFKLGQDGEILVRGKTLCRGYVQGDQVVLPLDADGWFATGDVGTLDEEGRLKILGRKDTMFISGGENIQPEEIEGVLSELPGIAQCMVVPIPHEEFGQRPVAFVQVDATDVSDDEMAVFLRGRLPGFKVPDHFFPWPEKLDQAGIKFSRAELVKRALSAT